MDNLIEKYSMTEEDAIQALLQITEDSYKYCKDISSERYTNVLAELTLWKLVVPNETSSSQNRERSTPIKTNSFIFEENTITLDEIETLYSLLNSQSSTVNCNEVDSTLAKIGLNVTNLSNIKDMLQSSHEGTGTLVYESFYRQLIVDLKWRKDILESVEPFLRNCCRICWLMVSKDPPMYLKPSEEKGSKINEDFL